jgi:hypothetical protein
MVRIPSTPASPGIVEDSREHQPSNPTAYRSIAHAKHRERRGEQDGGEANYRGFVRLFFLSFRIAQARYLEIFRFVRFTLGNRIDGLTELRSG